MGRSCWGVLLLSCILHSQLSSQPSPGAASSARPHGTTSPQGVLPSWALMGVLPEPGHPKHLGREPILLGPILGPTAGRSGRRVRWRDEREPAVGCCGGKAAPRGSFLPSPGPRPSPQPHGVLGKPRASGGHLLPETLLGPALLQGWSLLSCGKVPDLGPELPRHDCHLPPLSHGTFTWLPSMHLGDGLLGHDGTWHPRQNGSWGLALRSSHMLQGLPAVVGCCAIEPAGALFFPRGTV